jgi:hypothetical protein
MSHKDLMMIPRFQHGEQLGFHSDGESNYLEALRDDYHIKEKALQRQLQSALGEVERDTLAKAVEELRRDYKTKVASAKWNLYFG